MPKILHPDGRLARVLLTAESAEILKAIQEVSGSIPDAARALGVSRRSLYERIDRLGLRRAAGLDGGEVPAISAP